MSEENNKPKATLIKHVVNPTEHNKEQKSPAKEPEAKPKAPAEKRRVVVVKKKVVVVKPQARKEAEKPENEKKEGKKTSKDEGSKEASEKKKTASEGRTSSVVRKAHRHTGSENLSTSPLHNGPVVIRPTNLPPVPNQGLTVKDHKELQDKNPGGISSKESPVPSTGPRVAGMVGGRPAPGTRPQYRPPTTIGGVGIRVRTHVVLEDPPLALVIRVRIVVVLEDLLVLDIRDRTIVDLLDQVDTDQIRMVLQGGVELHSNAVAVVVDSEALVVPPVLHLVDLKVEGIDLLCRIWLLLTRGPTRKASKRRTTLLIRNGMPKKRRNSRSRDASNRQQPSLQLYPSPST